MSSLSSFVLNSFNCFVCFCFVQVIAARGGAGALEGSRPAGGSCPRHLRRCQGEAGVAARPRKAMEDFARFWKRFCWKEVISDEFRFHFNVLSCLCLLALPWARRLAFESLERERRKSGPGLETRDREWFTCILLHFASFVSLFAYIFIHFLLLILLLMHLR